MKHNTLEHIENTREIETNVTLKQSYAVVKIYTGLEHVESRKITMLRLALVVGVSRGIQ